MKKTIQLLGLLVMIFMFQLTANSQTVSFGYDACGNRISREIVLPKTNQAQNSPEDPFVDERELTDMYETEIGEVQVQISPNPNGGQFKVTLPGVTAATDAKLYLHSANGQLVFEKENLETVNNIDIRHKQNGTYILTFIINGKKESWKVIKQ
jgi:hypothetical protein